MVSLLWWIYSQPNDKMYMCCILTNIDQNTTLHPITQKWKQVCSLCIRRRTSTNTHTHTFTFLRTQCFTHRPTPASWRTIMHVYYMYCQNIIEIVKLLTEIWIIIIDKCQPSSFIRIGTFGSLHKFNIISHRYCTAHANNYFLLEYNFYTIVFSFVILY